MPPMARSAAQGVARARWRRVDVGSRFCDGIGRSVVERSARGRGPRLGFPRGGEEGAEEFVLERACEAPARSDARLYGPGSLELADLALRGQGGEPSASLAVHLTAALPKVLRGRTGRGRDEARPGPGMTSNDECGRSVQAGPRFRTVGARPPQTVPLEEGSRVG